VVLFGGDSELVTVKHKRGTVVMSHRAPQREKALERQDQEGIDLHWM